MEIMHNESRTGDSKPDGHARREIANSPVAKWWVWIPAIALSVAAGAGLTWALLSILTPPADPSEASDYTFVAVAPGEVGASIALNTVTEWFPVPVGANMASGVVTQVSVAPGDEVATGGVLYRVNQRPVVIAQGDVPMFRTVGPDSAGADVAQLQEMLKALAYYSGAVDGRLGQGTTAAVKAWQKSLGL
jgi:multidrug efflux pump subunit AcrA (membrane-fusion protein)